MSEYKIEEHGDLLEKFASNFIKNKIPFYEEMWKIFIGHKGDGTKADLPGFPNPDLRDKFSEHTYTVLESAVINFSIIESQIFQIDINEIENYIEFNKSLTTFFANIGRIKDNLEKATNVLLGRAAYDNLIKHLDLFYQPRNVILHGRKIPFSVDKYGLIKIPTLYKKVGSIEPVWDDKKNTWEDYTNFKEEYASDTVENIFFELMKIVNNEFAKYHNYIEGILGELGLRLNSPRASNDRSFPSISGNTEGITFNVTNISSSNRSL